MTKVTKTIYITKDGVEFEDSQKAHRHEEAVEIASYLVNHPELSWISAMPIDAVKVLLEKYDITPKE